MRRLAKWVALVVIPLAVGLAVIVALVRWG